MSVLANKGTVESENHGTLQYRQREDDLLSTLYEKIFFSCISLIFNTSAYQFVLECTFINNSLTNLFVFLRLCYLRHLGGTILLLTALPF